MRTRSNKFRWMHAAAVIAAIVAVMLIATGASLWHIDTPGSAATCPICHYAHISALPGLPAGSVTAHVSVAWILPAEAVADSAAPVARASAPRAPPA